MDGRMDMGQTTRECTEWSAECLRVAGPGRALRLLIASFQMKKPGRVLTGLELLQLPAKVLEAGLQVLGLRVHLVHALLQLGQLLLLPRATVLLAAAPALQGLLHLQGQGRDAGPSSGGGANLGGGGEGEGRVSLTSLISSCRRSSSEFCSLMKLNSAKFRSSTGGESGKAGSRETETSKRRDTHRKAEKEMLRKATKTQRQRETETERYRQRNRHRGQQREIQGKAERQKERATERKSQKCRERHRETEK